jgi:hypothetical protein
MMNNKLRGIKKSIANIRPVRLAYQPPANSTFLSEQINQPTVLFSHHQQPTTSQTSQTNRP